MTGRHAAVLIWLALLAGSIFVVARTGVDTDMTAFLPRSASPAQRVLVDQLREGVLSRLVLVAIEGVPVARSAELSKRLASRLRGRAALASVENGEEGDFARDRDFLWSNRYLLSDQVVAGRFETAGLRDALEHDLAALGSSAGFLLKRLLDSDPTAEMAHLVEQQIGGGAGPVRQDGVWVSADLTRALLLVRLRTAGSDLDGAERALTDIRTAFDEARDTPDRAGRLVMTGPPVFAVEARARIKSDATRLSALASLFVAAVLLFAYRSPRLLALAFVPVASGALAGVAAVGLAFRTVHGITLGFGATLIGEAVDYAVYLFTQTPPASPVGPTLRRIWPTLRLGVLTSICGFSAMLLSSFEGFVQLGLFTITGLAVAVCVTRWVLPPLVPARFAGVQLSPLVLRIAALAARGRTWGRGSLVVALAASSLALGQDAFGQHEFWAGDLSSLSPVPPEAQRLDRALRQDMRAPDVAYLVVSRQASLEAALQAGERLEASLAALVRAGALAGFDAPGRYLPSRAAQGRRQDALPPRERLQQAIDAAQEGLGFRPGLFAPFVAAVAQARTQPPISRADLDGTSLSLKLDTLLRPQGEGWAAMLSLRGVSAPADIGRAVAGEPGSLLIDLKAESNRLLGTFLREGAGLAVLGATAILALLLVSLRSIGRVSLVMAPLAAAVLVTLAALRLGGHALSVFNLFGLLLVVAIGSNYGLFLERHRGEPADADAAARLLGSLLLANVCTVTGFAILATSQTPVLHDLGLPVAIGTFLSLAFAVMAMPPASGVGPHAA